MRKKNMLKYGTTILATAGIIGGSVISPDANAYYYPGGLYVTDKDGNNLPVKRYGMFISDNVHNTGAGGMVNCVGGETCVEKVGDEIHVSYEVQMSNIVMSSYHGETARGSVIAFPSVIDNPKLEVVAAPYNPVGEEYPDFPRDKYLEKDENGNFVDIDPNQMSEEMRKEYDKDLKQHEEKVREYYMGYKTLHDIGTQTESQELSSHPSVKLKEPYNIKFEEFLSDEVFEKFQKLDDEDKLSFNRYNDNDLPSIEIGGTTKYLTTKDGGLKPYYPDADYVTYIDGERAVEMMQEQVNAINKMEKNDILEDLKEDVNDLKNKKEEIQEKINKIGDNPIDEEDKNKRDALLSYRNNINEKINNLERNIKIIQEKDNSSKFKLGRFAVANSGTSNSTPYLVNEGDIEDDLIQSEYIGGVGIMTPHTGIQICLVSTPQLRLV